MATVASFNVALVASTGRFVSAISRAERQWNQLAKSIQRQAKTLPESIRSAVPASLALGRNVVKLGAVAGAALSGLAAWGVRLAAQWEQTQIAFTALLGSADAANRFLGQLVEFAARTPFNLTNLAQASRQLLAYGFAAEQVLPTLRAIGDAVSALGGGADEIERAVLAVGQMQAKGKIAAEEMMQLTELGIPAWEALAEAIGVSVPEAMKLVEKRAIDASTGIAAILEGINRRFAGAMEVQSKTLLGRLSTLRDNIEIILRGLGQDILRLTRLGERIDRLTQAVSRFAAVVAEHGFMGALARAFPPWVQVVIVGITGAIVGGLVPAIIAWLIPALKKLGVSLWATLRPLLPWMAVGAAVAVTAYLLARAWGHLGDVARAVWSAIGAVALYGASLVVRGVGLILAGIGAIVPAFRGAAQAVLGLADSLKNAASQSWASARSAAQMIRTAQQAQAGQEGVAKAGQRAADSQKQVAEGMEAVAKAAADNIQSFDQVHQIQEEMAESPAATMPEMPAFDMAGAVPGIGGIGAALGEQLASVADAAAAAWNRLKQAMEPVNRAVEWIRTNWPTIGPIVEDIAGLITVLLIPALIKTGVEAMIAGGKVLASWAMQAAGAVVHGATMVGQLVLAGAKWAWLGIQAMLNAGKVVLAWAMQGWQAVASVAVQVAQFVILGAKWVWMGRVALANAARIAVAWFVALGPVGWVIAIVALVAAVVALNWDRIREWTAQAWTAVVDRLSRAWKWIKVTAIAVWQAVVDWVVSKWKAIRSRTIAVWTAITGWLSGIWQGIVNAVSSTWQSIVNWVFTKWAELQAGTQAAWTSIRDWLYGVWQGLVNRISSVWKSIRSGAVGAWQRVKDTILGVWHGIKKGIAACVNRIIDVLNGMIRGMNRISFTVPTWVPIIGGKSWGFNLPEIPYVALAEGGEVRAPTLALLGERGPETVVPLGRSELAQEIASALAQAAYAAIRDAFRIEVARGRAGTGQQEIVLRLNDRTLARALMPALIAEAQRTGLPIIVRPQGA